MGGRMLLALLFHCPVETGLWRAVDRCQQGALRVCGSTGHSHAPASTSVCVWASSPICVHDHEGQRGFMQKQLLSFPSRTWLGGSESPCHTNHSMSARRMALSRAVDAGNTRLLWPGLDSGLCLHSLLSVLKLPSFWLFDNCCLDFVSVSSLIHFWSLSFQL